MQAHRTRQFVVGHTFIAAIAFGTLVSLLTLIVTLVFTGDLLGLRENSGDVDVTTASESASAPAPQLDRSERIAALQAVKGTEALSLSDYRDLEVNEGAGKMMAPAATSQLLEGWELLEQKPGLFTQPKAAAPSQGDIRFFEENVFNFSSQRDGLPYRSHSVDLAY